MSISELKDHSEKTSFIIQICWCFIFCRKYQFVNALLSALYDKREGRGVGSEAKDRKT